ncbi:MAG: gamma-glutamyltransferase, partial [Microcoleus sp.]
PAGYGAPSGKSGLTLQMIASNPASFYTENLVRAIASDLAKNRGIITLDDLKNYTPIWRNPICGSFGAYEICAMSPPRQGKCICYKS